MNTSRYTQLLNYNNFALIGGDDRIFNTTPKELSKFICDLPSDVKRSPIGYLTVINYCKSLILNPGLSNFDLTIHDILKLWEIRLICMIMFLQSGVNDKMIQDQLIQFEVKNLITQFIYLNRTQSTSITKNVLHDQAVKFKLNQRFEILLNWIKYHGRDVQLVDMYYRNVYQLRQAGDKEHLQAIYWAIVSAMYLRHEVTAIAPLLDCVVTDTDKKFKDELTSCEDLDFCGQLALQRYLKWQIDQIETNDEAYNEFDIDSNLKMVYDKWQRTLSVST